MPRKLLTSEQDAYLRSLAKGRSREESRKLLLEVFDLDLTKEQMTGYCKNHKIKFAKKNPRKKTYRLPKDLHDYILSHYRGVGPAQMVRDVKTDLGYTMTVQQMNNLYKRHGLRSGVNGQFKKGHVPFTKGKKREEFLSSEDIERVKKTQFKKGQKPPNSVPIGYVSHVQGDSYYWVKINDIPKAKKTVNWRKLHELMYEFYYGPVPEGNVVFFKNKDTNDFSKENLGIMTKTELVEMNKRRRISEHAEITEVNLTLTRLEAKRREIERIDDRDNKCERIHGITEMDPS